MTGSPVYFKEISNGNDHSAVAYALKQVIKKSGLCDALVKGGLTPIKVHMGEKNNTGHIPASVVKVMVDNIKARGAKPYIVETNVLYHGKRVNAVDHLMTAYEHGFSIETLGAPIIIADGLWGENAYRIAVNQQHCAEISAAHPVKYFDSLISMAHVTGHMLTGFAASLKNIGMGLASRAGKLKQHSNIKPHVRAPNCTLCRRCIEQCPVAAISVDQGHARIDPQTCVGCGDCIAACMFNAIADDYGEQTDVLVEKMVEYAYGILQPVKHKIFFNFALKITKNCDCMAKDEPRIVEDIGIFASHDPVACDAAAADCVIERAGDDIFKKAFPQASLYGKQLEYAAKIGVGSRAYTLTRVE